MSTNMPRATARLQFHSGFKLDDATAQVDYYAALGVSHLYASPLLTAKTGSTHGYDIADPTRVNPELGGDEALVRLSTALRRVGLGLIMDIVPNHMSAGPENPWWQDVFEFGAGSKYAGWFDIDWNSSDPALTGKILAPYLGQPYGEALRSGDLKLAYDDDTRKLYIHYFSHRFPLAPNTYDAVFDGGLEGSLDDALKSGALADGIARFDTKTEDGVAVMHALLERQHFRLTWWRNAAEEINWRRFFEVSDLAGVRIESDDAFDAVHEHVFKLYAQGLIDGVRVDHVDGLADPAGYCLKLRQRLCELAPSRPDGAPRDEPYIIVEKILEAEEGLRENWAIDGTTGYDFMDQVGAVLHEPAGADPLAAMWTSITGQTRSFGEEVKLARGELLARNFVGELDGLSRALLAVGRASLETRDHSLAAIRRVLTELLLHFPVYRTYVGQDGRDAVDEVVFEEAMCHARANLRRADQALLEQVGKWLGGRIEGDKAANDAGTGAAEAIDAGTPYGKSGVSSQAGQSGQDAPSGDAGARARAGSGPADGEGAVASVAQAEARDALATLRRLTQRAVTKFQQLTPPLAAKSVEDTAFYRYGRLLSRNEVGANPGQFHLSAEAFHQHCLERSERFPHAMLATATHDHKRGEDVRARLMALAEMPQQWERTVRRWMALNDSLAAGLPAGSRDGSTTSPSKAAPNAAGADHPHSAGHGNGSRAPRLPRPADQLMLYQMLVGAWPLNLAVGDSEGIRQFLERISAWQTKAVREAKRDSDWAMPDDAYETLCHDFLLHIFDQEINTGFVAELVAFVRQIATAGACNSLAQTVLRLTTPGVPDLYQGTELWDFSLVDPDNRTPVDFVLRRSLLDSAATLDEKATNWKDGGLKQAVVAASLQLRKRRPALFDVSTYVPLAVTGALAGNLIAFLRHDGEQAFIAVVSRFPVSLELGFDSTSLGLPRQGWGDTAIVLPDDLPQPVAASLSGRLRECFTGQEVRFEEGGGQRLEAGHFLGRLPVAILEIGQATDD